MWGVLVLSPRNQEGFRQNSLRSQMETVQKSSKYYQGVDKLPPTSGALNQHILRAHLQARIWSQDLVIHPQIPDPCQLGWFEEDGRLRPVLSHKQAAPEAVVELVKCSCSRSACSRNTCKCKANNLHCTEICVVVKLKKVRSTTFHWLFLIHLMMRVIKLTSLPRHPHKEMWNKDKHNLQVHIHNLNFQNQFYKWE